MLGLLVKDRRMNAATLRPEFCTRSLPGHNPAEPAAGLERDRKGQKGPLM